MELIERATECTCPLHTSWGPLKGTSSWSPATILSWVCYFFIIKGTNVVGRVTITNKQVSVEHCIIAVGSEVLGPSVSEL